MKQLKLSLIASLLLSFNSFSQTTTFTKVWEKVYGGQRMEASYYARKLFLTPDSNLIFISDFALSNISGNKTVPNCGGEIAEGDIWILKLDQQGNKLWEETLGGTDMEWANAAILEQDGSMLIAGHSKSQIACEKSQDRYDANGDYWIIKIDSAGNKLWDKRYGWQNYEVINDIVRINHGYLLIGFAAYPSGYTGGDVTDTSVYAYDNFWIVNIDSAGIKVWDNMYGGYLTTTPRTGVIDNQNNYYFVGGTATNGISGDISTLTFGGTSDGWIIKIDSAGNKIWDKRYGGNKSDGFSTAIISSSDELVLCASSQFNSSNGNISDTVSHGGADILMVKMSLDSGNILLQKRIGSNFNDNAVSIIEMPDKGYFIAAKSNSDAGYEKTENPKGDYDFWLIRTDSMFNVIWDKTIGGNSYEGVPSIVFLNDSIFVIAGQSASDVSGDKTLPLYDTINSGVSAGDIWIMKYVISTPTGIDELSNPTFTVFPNPVLNLLLIRSLQLSNKEVTVTVFDALSKQKMQKKFAKNNNSMFEIDVSSLARGVYFIKINNTVQKFVKI